MLPGRVDVAIVGAGFGGLGLAIQLKRHGMEDFVVLERSGDVGGTWNSNTYPGAQCDIPSNLYSWSFALKHDWSRAYPERDEIHAYFRDCVEHFGVGGHIHLDTELLDAEWRDDHWHVETSRGRARRARARGRARPAERALDPRPPRSRQLRGARVPHRELGSRPRPHRPRRGGGGHRRHGDPGGAPDQGPGEEAHRLPADPAVGDLLAGPQGDQARALAVPARAGRPARHAREHVGGAGADSRWA